MQAVRGTAHVTEGEGAWEATGGEELETKESEKLPVAEAEQQVKHHYIRPEFLYKFKCTKEYAKLISFILTDF